MMKKSNWNTPITPINRQDYLEEKEFSYPLNSSIDDVYEKSKIASEIESTNKSKEENDDLILFDLDIPGAELDDEDEELGEEDEENNYYSLGGDRHNDLDENS
jgi:hypothetical protein